MKTFTFYYNIHVNHSDGTKEIPVCKISFISMHGITRQRIETTQLCMVKTGFSLKDLQGRRKIPEDTLKSIKDQKDIATTA